MRLVAVDKPAGMATAAGGGIDDDASLHAWVTRHVEARTFIVHRLDRGTSGVLVFAKAADAHRRLSQAFERREVGKRYLALVDGHVRRATGEIAEPLRAFGSGRVGVDPKGSEALTPLSQLERLEDADARVEPLTGRRHRSGCTATPSAIQCSVTRATAPSGPLAGAADMRRSCGCRWRTRRCWFVQTPTGVRGVLDGLR